MVAMNLRAVQLQSPNRELSREGENMTFIHIGCWPLCEQIRGARRNQSDQIQSDYGRLSHVERK